MNYGRAMRIVRTARSMTQSQFANALGVDASYISRVESGRRTPPHDFLASVSREFDIPMTLLTFLACEAEELKGISRVQADAFAQELLGLFMDDGRE